MNHWKLGASWLKRAMLLCMRGYPNRWALDLFICSSWWADSPLLCLSSARWRRRRDGGSRDWGKRALAFSLCMKQEVADLNFPEGWIWTSDELGNHVPPWAYGKKTQSRAISQVFLEGGAAGPVFRERVCGVDLGILQQTAHLSRTGHSECTSRTDRKLKPGVRRRRSPREEMYHQGSVTGLQVAAVRISRCFYRRQNGNSATRVRSSSCRFHRYSESLSPLPPES